MFPAIVLMQAEIDLHKRAPLRPLRLANEMHSRLLRCAVRFERIAFDARANDIFPRRWPATIAGNHMIEVQVVAIESLSAVLAHVFVAFKNVMPCKLNFFLGQMVVHHQQNDSWQPNAK